MQLINDFFLEHTPDHLHIDMQRPCDVTSSAVLNGGECLARHVVNQRVPLVNGPVLEPPEETLQQYCRARGWQGPCVGMMTAASMNSFRLARNEAAGTTVIAMVTTGLENLRRAGDRADYRVIADEYYEVGTINMIMLTTARLTRAAILEAFQIITEAKVVALQQLQLSSPVSSQPATGTGTDAMVFINGEATGPVRYCGKHTLMGELLATTVIQALSASLEYYQDAGVHVDMNLPLRRTAQDD